MSDEAITPEAVAGLADKLDGLDLTDAERSALDALLDVAAESDADVQGFGVVFEVETTVHGLPKQNVAGDGGRRAETYPKLVKGLGFDLSPDGVWTDMRPLS